MLTLKIAFRNMRRRKIRTTIALIGVIIASALFVGVNSTVDILTYELVQSFTDFLGDFDIMIYGTSSNVFFDPENITSKVLEVDAVDVAIPRLIFRGIATSEENKTTGLLLVGIYPELDDRIGSFEVIQGEISFAENETILLSDIAKFLNVRVGELLNVTTYNFINKTFKITQLKIVGIVDQEGKLPLNMRNVIFMSKATLQKMLGLYDNQSANFVFIQLKEDVFDYNDIEGTINKLVSIGSEIQLKIGLDYNVVLVKGRVFERVSASLESQRIMLNIFVFITVLMAGVLIVSTMLMNVNERIREFGILRSLGFARYQIFLIVLTESIIIGLVGSVIGLYVGIILGSKIITPIVVARLTQDTTEIITISINPITLEYGFLIGFLVCIGAGLFPAYYIYNLTPIEALSASARKTILVEKHLKKLSPERVSWSLFWSGLFIFATMSLMVVLFPLIRFYFGQSIITLVTFLSLGLLLVGITVMFTAILPVVVRLLARLFSIFAKIEGSLAARNLIKYKRRTTLTFFMLTTSIAFIFMIGSLTQSYAINAQMAIRYETGSDIVIYLNEPVPESIISNITAISGVKAATPITAPLTVKVGDLILWKQYTIKVYGINATTFMSAVYAEDAIIDWPKSENPFMALTQNNESIAIATGLAQALKLSEMDTIRVEIYGKSKLMNVGMLISALPAFSFTKFEQKAARSEALISLETYKNLTRGILTYERILVRVKEGFDVESIANSINNLIGTDYDIQVITTQELIEMAQESYSQVLQLFMTLLSFGIIISVLGHVTSLLTTVRERIWEIGIFRSIGVSREQVILIFIVEAIILSIAGYICGLLSSLIVVTEITYTNNLMSDIPLVLTIPIDLASVIFALVIGVSAIASYIFTKKPISINIVDALRYGLRE
ncbi:MAG: FtsX-like permease family protein [Candidatus Odinarchaeota archaeon]|nr:FtsX-like permease family protein [Candidatus Odinarchaeota archaeon]